AGGEPAGSADPATSPGSTRVYATGEWGMGLPGSRSRCRAQTRRRPPSAPSAGGTSRPISELLQQQVDRAELLTHDPPDQFRQPLQSLVALGRRDRPADRGPSLVHVAPPIRDLAATETQSRYLTNSRRRVDFRAVSL